MGVSRHTYNKTYELANKVRVANQIESGFPFTIVVYNTLDITLAELSEFQQKFFLILNVAVGGNWPGNPDATTVFPQTMFVDYVRVFQ